MFRAREKGEKVKRKIALALFGFAIVAFAGTTLQSCGTGGERDAVISVEGAGS